MRSSTAPDGKERPSGAKHLSRCRISPRDLPRQAAASSASLSVTRDDIDGSNEDAVAPRSVSLSALRSSTGLSGLTPSGASSTASDGHGLHTTIGEGFP